MVRKEVLMTEEGGQEVEGDGDTKVGRSRARFEDVAAV